MTFRIVQLHDGTIDFSSEPDKGTTFMIRLPLAV
jgi:signal transduction histidine kinase